MLYSNLYMVVLSCYASLLAWFFLACLLVSVWLWSLVIFLVMLALLACIINCLHKRSLSASFSQADLIHLENWIPGGPSFWKDALGNLACARSTSNLEIPVLVHLPCQWVCISFHDILVAASLMGYTRCFEREKAISFKFNLCWNYFFSFLSDKLRLRCMLFRNSSYQLGLLVMVQCFSLTIK